MQKKRTKGLIVVGWLVIAFASYLFYQSVAVLTEFLRLPWSVGEIIEHGGTLKIMLVNAAFTKIFSLLFLVAAIGVLCVKRWAVVLLFSVFAFDFAKRIYLMAALSYAFNRIFALEIILFLLSIYCLFRRNVRESLR